VNSDLESKRARRYLFGEASEEECLAIEQEYFGEIGALDLMSAAEDDLIEEYLGGQLEPDERRRFERVYLAAPHHRIRVETIRRLIVVSSQPAPWRAQGRVTLRAELVRTWWWQLAVAATVLMAAAVWVLAPSLRQRRPQPPPPGGGSAPASAVALGPSPPGVPLTAPRVLAVSIPPITTRSAQDNPPVVIPPGIDLVAVQLDAGRQPLAPVRASIRTMSGNEVWQGAAAVSQRPAAGVVARIDIPAAMLRPDDYLIVLYETGATGAETERYRYFVRVRAR
jgi:hypothetical protein